MNGKNKGMVVLSNLHTKEPLLLVRTFVDESICGLRGSKRVVIDLLVVVCLFVVRSFCRFVVATVEETVAELSGIGELYPLEMIVEVTPTLDLANMPLLPVGSSRGKAISE